jgi:Nicotinamide mononucleotide transporter
MRFSARISEASTTPAGYATVTLLFLATLASGYVLGGLDFVQGWGGGIAAVVATWYLIWKSQGYWAFMVVNAGLWTYLFFHVGLPMLAWLQISFLAMSVYGAVQWALVRLDIGFRVDRRSDVAGSVLAAAVLAYSVYAYWGMPGYTGTAWWALELGSVLTAIAAIWMDAFRYRMNWVAWTASNCLSAPLFLHGRLWGPLLTIPIYQAFNVLGWIRWTREERAIGAVGVARRPAEGVFA